MDMQAIENRISELCLKLARMDEDDARYDGVRDEMLALYAEVLDARDTDYLDTMQLHGVDYVDAAAPVYHDDDIPW